MVAFWNIRNVEGEPTEVSGIAVDKKMIIREVFFTAVSPPTEKVFESEESFRRIYDLNVLLAFGKKSSKAGFLLTKVLPSYNLNYVLDLESFLEFLKSNQKSFSSFMEKHASTVKQFELPLLEESLEESSLFDSLVSRIRMTTDTQGGLIVFSSPEQVQDSSLKEAFRMALAYAKHFQERESGE